METKQDFKLNSTTNDLEFTKSDLTFVSGIDYYIQKIKIKLQFFFGEWFLDTTKGLKFYDIVFVKNPDLFFINNLIKITITEEAGILQILEYSSSFDTVQRKFNVTTKVLTDQGDFYLDESLEIRKK